MDVDAGRILEGRATLDEVGREVFDATVSVAAVRVEVGIARPSGFILTYKTFDLSSGVPAGERDARGMRYRLPSIECDSLNPTQ